MVNVSDGKCRPQPARLKVCQDFLILQREEFIFPDEEDGYPAENTIGNEMYKENNRHTQQDVFKLTKEVIEGIPRTVLVGKRSRGAIHRQ